MLAVDLERLEAFEAGLDPVHPERSAVPPHILGYGEISTALAIGDDDLACKRMPMFLSEEEIAAYSRAFDLYTTHMTGAGIKLAPGQLVRLRQRCGPYYVLYLVQRRLPPEVIGNQIVRAARRDDAERLLYGVLRELVKVAHFNRRHAGTWALGIDGQISNWAATAWTEDGQPVLRYFDLTTPLIRQQSVELLDAELFLRSAPSYLRWVLRRFFLQDVLDRYYDLRRVVIDLIANLYKEGRIDLIPLWIECANRFFDQEAAELNIATLQRQEIDAYYREDAFIWRFYLAARRLDRRLHRWTGRTYPYVLPGRIRR
ncbi:MAG TPA: hypothetical protein GX400_21280 [Chloroflexi bacterium]|nr:hypothetical protein [Chloroflexota bacterium]